MNELRALLSISLKSVTIQPRRELLLLELVCKIIDTVLFQQKGNSSKINKGQIGSIPLVISSSNTTKPLAFQEEALNQMTLLVKPPIAIPGISGIAFRRYGVRSLAIRDISANLPCAIRPVSQDIAASQL